MMKLALERCFAAAVTAVRVDPLVSNVRAHRFYERLGFRRVARRRFGGARVGACAVRCGCYFGALTSKPSAMAASAIRRS